MSTQRTPVQSALENLLTAWSRLLFDSLAAAGVTRVVVSPGSRSTPFLLAAAATPGLQIQDAIDERAAAFFALGQARATGYPSVLLCTSGTAGAHYLPAVIEADQAGIPLLILTADRPTELLHVNANQTIDQRMLFEGYARRVVDLGTPDPAPSALRGLRRLAAQVVALTRAPHPGPVHLNVRARKPLEAIGAESPAARALDGAVRELLETPMPRVVEGESLPDAFEIEALARQCIGASRGVIVAGPAAADQARARCAVDALVEATGFPLLAEAASQLRFTGAAGTTLIDGFDWLYRLPFSTDAWRPDLVIQLGAPTVSPAWERFLDAHPGMTRIVIAPTGWPDPQGTAGSVIHAEIGKTCTMLAGAVARQRGKKPASGSAFAAELRQVNHEIWQIVESETDAGDDRLTEADVARLTVRSLPEGAWLALGNSLSIRNVDAYCPGPLRDVRVLSQRGVSGIDGLISGAAGVAHVAEDPVVLLLGDISFLHDLGGLMLAGAARVPLAIVIVNNGGGRIFEELPVAGAASGDMMRHFTTPQDFDFEQAAGLFRHAFSRVSTRAELTGALAAAYKRVGCTVIDASVPAHGAAEDRTRILGRLRDYYAG